MVHLLISGGRDVDGAHLMNTEIYVSVTGQFEYGPDLPYGVDGHCMAKVNETHFIMSGGRTDIDDTVTTMAMLYDMDANVWTNVANMSVER